MHQQSTQPCLSAARHHSAACKCTASSPVAVA
jgi:hypothetical protein